MLEPEFTTSRRGDKCYAAKNTIFNLCTDWNHALWNVLWSREFNIPIQLGQLAGTNFWPALIGFLVTAIGLPFLGILAIGLSGSTGLRDLASRVHPVFGIGFATVLYLTIGPFFAIPRTATVPFVVGFEPYISPGQAGLWLGIFSFVFFAIVYFFSLHPAKVMDYIGKYLTPAFLVFLFFINWHLRH